MGWFENRNVEKLAAEWRRAKPWPHLVVDDFLPESVLQELSAALVREAFTWQQDEIFSFLAAAGPFGQEPVQRFVAEASGPSARAAVETITGRPSTRIELQGYAYPQHSYLLPHSDHRPGFGRQVAFVFYAAHHGEMKGGELELYACRMRGDTIMSARPAVRIEPKPNRLVLLDVSAGSLHRVNEIRSGTRMSLAGWYLP